MMFTKNTRIASFIMLICMISAMFTFLLPVSADGVAPEISKDLMTTEEILATYLTKVYENQREKLATMEYKKSSPDGNYRLYIDSYSGEIAVECVSTGEILLSNPYDTASVASEDVRKQLLSQVIINFRDLEDNGKERQFISYTDSALFGQIDVKNTKTGIRVEYVLGKESSRSLVPRWIEATRFEEQIMAYIDPEKSAEEEYIYNKLLSYYSLINTNSEKISSIAAKEYETKYPCVAKSYYTEEKNIGIIDNDKDTVGPDLVSGVTGFKKDKMAIYAIDTKVETSEQELNRLEGYIKRFCPHYNFEEVKNDHLLTGYKGSSNQNAVFYFSVEYSITNEGLIASVPGNSITYDEEKYNLVNVILLPYMGASNGKVNDGYTFIPDGSGTIIRNKDINAIGSAYTLTGQVYGPDYAYHTINKRWDGKSEVFTAPVFGIVDTATHIEYGDIISQREEIVYLRDEKGNLILNTAGDPEPIYIYDSNGRPMSYPDGSPVTETEIVYEYEEIKTTSSTGVFAVITEGEALAYITSSHGGGLSHNYNTVYAEFYPRSSDSYNLGDSISVAGNTEWTITSDRKYTGRFTIKYVMLSDKENAKYAANYVGMANAYRDHLVSGGFISKIENAKQDIPLYLETFGMIEVQEMVMTIPTWVDTPLSTFEDVEKMYASLGEAGITNVKFKLTGFTEGGWKANLAPSTVKFEKVLGGKDGYNTLVENAEKTGGLLEVFPDFDFANVSSTKFFDKFSQNKDAARTVDDRYAGKREYSSIYQTFQYTGSICVSPAAYEKLYGHFEKAMKKFNKGGISVSTLGSDVNTDFNEDNPLNREDGKLYTVELLSKLKNDYKSGIMVSQGNAYSWPYASHILNVALEGSNYIRTSESIPFIGMVLHGYINIAGSPTNMQGNVEREMLKIIENGASPYYVLVAQNSSELKEYFVYSDYYSIDFENWKNDVIETYNTINKALYDVQTSQVVDHRFVIGERVLDADELKEKNENYAAQLAKYKAEREEALEVYLKELAKAEEKKQAAIAAGEDYTEDEVIAPFEYKEFVYTDSMSTTVDDNSIVYMEYENGISFILNYNLFDVHVEIDGVTYEVGAMSFIKTYPTK